LALPEDEAKAVAAKAAEVPAERDGEGHIPSFLVLLIAFWVITSILRGLGGRGSGLWWLPLILLNSGRGGGDWGGGGGGGGFSGGGGSFGGGGSSGSW